MFQSFSMILPHHFPVISMETMVTHLFLVSLISSHFYRFSHHFRWAFPQAFSQHEFHRQAPEPPAEPAVSSRCRQRWGKFFLGGDGYSIFNSYSIFHSIFFWGIFIYNSIFLGIIIYIYIYIHV